MKDISPTRTELLKLQQKKKLAVKGQKLLKSKQDALIMNFFSLVAELRKKQAELSDGLSGAFHSLRLAQALDGFSFVKSAAFNSPSSFDVDLSHSSIMGVRVPRLSLSVKSDSRFVGSNQLVSARDDFKRVFSQIVKIAELESGVRRLAGEIKKTKRRLNSLEQRKIPELNDLINFVKMSLSEVERESFFRTKLVKGRLENES